MKDLAHQRYDEACAHARAGREDEAIPCYVEVLELGLGDPWRPQALLGLGSSYRNVLRHADAIAVLREATAEYPDDDALRVFLALALWSGGREREAFVLVGKVAVESAGMGGYRRAASMHLTTSSVNTPHLKSSTATSEPEDGSIWCAAAAA